MDHSRAASILIQLIEEYHDYNTGGICEYVYPTAVEFCKQVSRGRPCVYNVQNIKSQDTLSNGRGTMTGKGAESERFSIVSSPAFSWTPQSLCAKVTEQVEVAVTPDGRADALYVLPRSKSDDKNGDEQSRVEEEDVFVQPANINMALADLLSKVTPSSCHSPSKSKARLGNSPVYYLQSQNSNLTSTVLSPLLTDLPSTIPFATPTLGEPEAINIWIGNHESVTSTHRDPYENLYLVLRGSKTFTLYPPVEELCLHAKMVRTGRLVFDSTTVEDSEKWKIEMDEETSSSPHPSRMDGGGDDGDDNGMLNPQDSRIPWIPISPLGPRPALNSLYPYYKHAHPQTITVSAGQMLYLPSGWFHHVTQECGTWDDGSPAPCVAVNYWFDMDYEGERFVLREMVGRLVSAVRTEEGTDTGSMAAKEV